MFAIIATVGIILAALYMLLMFQRTMQGPPPGVLLADADDAARTDRCGATAVDRLGDAAGARPRPREMAVVAPLIALIILLGFYPKPLLDVINPAVAGHHAATSAADPAPSTGGADDDLRHRTSSTTPRWRRC